MGVHVYMCSTSCSALVNHDLPRPASSSFLSHIHPVSPNQELWLNSSEELKNGGCAGEGQSPVGLSRAQGVVLVAGSAGVHPKCSRKVAYTWCRSWLSSSMQARVSHCPRGILHQLLKPAFRCLCPTRGVQSCQGGKTIWLSVLPSALGTWKGPALLLRG